MGCNTPLITGQKDLVYAALERVSMKHAHHLLTIALTLISRVDHYVFYPRPVPFIANVHNERCCADDNAFGVASHGHSILPRVLAHKFQGGHTFARFPCMEERQEGPDSLYISFEDISLMQKAKRKLGHTVLLMVDPTTPYSKNTDSPI